MEKEPRAFTQESEESVRENEKKKRILLPTVERRFKSAMREIRDETPELPRDEVVIRGLEKLKERLALTISDRAIEISDLLGGLTRQENEEEDSFIQRVSLEITNFLSSYSPEEIEAMARRFPQYQDTELNRLLRYGISGDVVHIHVPVTFLANPLELKALFIDGLRKLADQLQNDPKLSSINKITASSELVAKGQRAFRDAGFTITYIDEEKSSGDAEISKEKLIEVYGSKTGAN